MVVPGQEGEVHALWGTLQAALPAPYRNGRLMEVQELKGGITNRNFLLTVGTERLVLRVGGGSAEALGIDREVEWAAARRAEELGIGAEMVAFLPAERMLVSRFVAGEALTAEDLRQEPVLWEVAELLRRLHGAQPIPGSFSVFRVVEAYHAFCRAAGVPLPEGFDADLDLVRRIEAALPAIPLRPCHNDLLAANFLRLPDGRLVLLDWEYAGMGDPFFDLGNFAANQALTPEGEEVLLAASYGGVDAGMLARLRLMRVLSDLREAMWGFVQSGASDLDFDFRTYALAHHGRVRAALQDRARLRRWLAAVGR